MLFFFFFGNSGQAGTGRVAVRVVEKIADTIAESCTSPDYRNRNTSDFPGSFAAPVSKGLLQYRTSLSRVERGTVVAAVRCSAFGLIGPRGSGIYAMSVCSRKTPGGE